MISRSQRVGSISISWGSCPTAGSPLLSTSPRMCDQYPDLSNFSYGVNASAVPEPSSLVLLGAGSAVTLGRKPRRRASGRLATVLTPGEKWIPARVFGDYRIGAAKWGTGGQMGDVAYLVFEGSLAYGANLASVSLEPQKQNRHQLSKLASEPMADSPTSIVARSVSGNLL